MTGWTLARKRGDAWSVGLFFVNSPTSQIYLVLLGRVDHHNWLVDVDLFKYVFRPKLHISVDINGIYIYTYKFMYIYIYVSIYVYYTYIYIYYTLHMKYIRYVSSMRILPADLWRPSCSWTTWRRWDGLPWRLGICRISPWQVFYVKDPSFASAFGVVWATKCWSLCTRFLGSHKSMVVVHMPLGVTRKIYRYAFLYTLYRPRIYIYMYIIMHSVYIYIYVYYTCIDSYIHTYMHACMHAYIHT